MEATTISSDIRTAETNHSNQIPWSILASVFSSFSIIIGLIWDICWHISIGRDGLFSAPHLLIYLGAIVAGLFSAYETLRKTFKGSQTEKAQSVKIWGIFYCSLGALFCIWGAIAMLTSAPFDDWWHNTYGLDVTILSPPHTVLILGMIGIQFGAMVGVIALTNRLSKISKTSKQLKQNLFWLFALSAGFLLTIWFTLLSEELGRMESHGSNFYLYAGIAFPLLLIATGQAFPHKWTITAVSAVYTIVMLGTLWIIPLFPAEPKLGPILHHIDHYQAFQFPLLLIFPAIVLDMLRNRFSNLSSWKLSLLYGCTFFAIFLMVQWPFGGFLMESPYARNWVFASDSWYFGNSPDWEFRYKFPPWMVDSGMNLYKGLLIALIATILSTRVGLSWGNWMKNIQR